jgi:hypothetical protein
MEKLISYNERKKWCADILASMDSAADSIAKKDREPDLEMKSQ